MQTKNIAGRSYYESEKARLIKEQKVLDKFLGGSGCCLICFNSNPLVLEEHHPAGRKHSDLTLTVCANHHAVLSRMQGSWPEEWLNKDISAYKLKAIMLRGVADMLKVISDHLLDQDDDENGGWQ